MRCNDCWRELEGRAVTTICGHLLCNEDANKILSNDGACPICDQVLSKSLMRPVDINPNEEWINMSMAGISPQILMKSAYRSVMFYIGQKELEMQLRMNRIVDQCRQKCETMQEKFTEKLEELHTAYKKMGKKCEMMEQEIQKLSKEKQELQEKFSEKARQKRKLDDMYDQLVIDYELAKRSAKQPAGNFFSSRNDSDVFASPSTMKHNRDPIRRENAGAVKDDIWQTTRRQNHSNSVSFDMSTSPHAKPSEDPVENTRKKVSNDGTRNPKPAGNFFSSRNDSDLFASPATMKDNRDPIRRGAVEEIWGTTTRQNHSFDISTSPHARPSENPVENTTNVGRQMFAGNLFPSLFSPMKRPPRPSRFRL